MSLNPDLLINHPRMLFDANASATTATDGTRAVQGSGTLWGATPPLGGPVQFTGLLQAQGYKPDGLASSASALAFGEVAIAGGHGGFAAGIGGVSGTVEGQGSVSALRTGARAWANLGLASLSAFAQPTLLSGSWFTDYGIRLQGFPGSWILVGGTTVRQGSGITTSAGVDGAAIWRSKGRLSLEFSGGRYLRDPYQGLPAGWYVSTGVRLMLWGPAPTFGASNVTLASLSPVGVNPAIVGSSISSRSVPSVTQGAPASGSGNSTHDTTGRGHRP
jgi:hypothetical protein